MSNWNDSIIQAKAYLATIAGAISGGKMQCDVSNADIATMQDDIALIKADIAAIRVILES